MVLKGVRTSFESLKTIHNRAIKNIKDIGEAGQVGPLEQLVENFEDVTEWCRLSQSELAPLVEEELNRLSVQTQQTYAEATSKVEEAIKELDLLKVEEQNIVEEIELSNQTLASATEDVEKACQMIARAYAILSKTEPVQRDEAAKLELLTPRASASKGWKQRRGPSWRRPGLIWLM